MSWRADVEVKWPTAAALTNDPPFNSSQLSSIIQGGFFFSGGVGESRSVTRSLEPTHRERVRESERKSVQQEHRRFIKLSGSSSYSGSCKVSNVHTLHSMNHTCIRIRESFHQSFAFVWKKICLPVHSIILRTMHNTSSLFIYWKKKGSLAPWKPIHSFG